MQSPPLLQGAGEEEEGLSSTPSFRRMPTHDVLPGFEESAWADSLFGSPPEIPAVDSRHEGVNPVGGGDDGDGDDDDDGSEEFEFSVLSRDSFDGIEPIAADEIFSNGQIRPIYPLFGRALFLDDAELLPREGEGGRLGDPAAAAAAAVEAGGEIGKAARLPLGKLMMEERDPPSTSSSEADELEGVPAENYCLWTPSSVPPSPDLGNRSHSTGDSSKRWRLRDLVIGRSHSDGRKKFFFLAPPHSSSSAETGEKACKSSSRDGGAAPSATPAAGGEKRKGKGKDRGAVRVVEMDMATAHRLYYGKGGAAGAAAAAAGDRRRSYLPYRQGLVGIFSNVNGGGGGGRPFHPI